MWDFVVVIEKMQGNQNHDVVAIRKYKWSEMCFVLNFRGIPVKSNMGGVELKEKMGRVEPEEREALDLYITPPGELIEKWEREGWFNKTYETVKQIVASYIKSLTDTVFGPEVAARVDRLGAIARAQRNENRAEGVGKGRVLRAIYTQKSDLTLSSRAKIARILMFHELKGCPIPLRQTKPSPEQEIIIKAVKGVIVVNSGPGTGKTETGVHKTGRLSDEGVLILSFTNAAVDNFRLRLPSVVDDITKVGVKHGAEVWVTTIDSVAAHLTPKSQKGTDFEMIVESAIRDIDQFGHIFLKPDGSPLYKHIILDEGQDVSKSRYDFVKSIYNRWGFESLTILGDPRQRLNIQCGGCFQKMLMDGSTELGDQDVLPTFDRPFVVNLTKTYRFQNPLLLVLANNLSSCRTEIHVPLVFEGKVCDSQKMRKFQKPEDIAADIIEKVERGVKPSDIAILSPVINKGPGKMMVEQIVSFLKSGRDPTQQEKERGETEMKSSVMTSKDIQEDSVYVSSIQSIKGLEFDHVYFVGASNYPTYMNKEYEDINEGMSMNFVANTRARRSITYLVDDTLRAPDDVPEGLTEGGEAKEATFTTESYPVAIRSSDISIDNYTKFFKSNLMAIQREDFGSFLTVHRGDVTRFSVADGMYEIISAVLARLEGVSIMHGALAKAAPGIVAEKINSGEIYDMIYKEGRSVTGAVAEGKVLVTDRNFDLVKTLRDGYDVTDFEMHQLFKKVMTGRNSVLRSMDQINDVVMKVSGILCGGSKEEAFEDESFYVKQVAFKGYINASGLWSKKATVVFTENMYLAALVSKRIGIKEDHTVFQVGLESGKIWKVPCPRMNEFQLEYMVKSLYSICSHMKLVRMRARYSLASVNREKPWYFVDTEFCPRDYRKSGTIYDVAIINGFDPYASLCTLVLIEPEAFNRLNELRRLRGIPELPFIYDSLKGSPKIREVYEFFCGLVGENDPLIWYFNAKEDISLFYEFHPFYDSAWERKSDKKNDWEFQKHLVQEDYRAENDEEGLGPYEFRFKDAMRFRGDGTATNRMNADEGGSMSERYQKLIGRDPEKFSHILLHTAVSDTLLLMEYVLTRELGRVKEE